MQVLDGPVAGQLADALHINTMHPRYAAVKCLWIGGSVCICPDCGRVPIHILTRPRGLLQAHPQQSNNKEMHSMQQTGGWGALHYKMPPTPMGEASQRHPLPA